MLDWFYIRSWKHIAVKGIQKRPNLPEVGVEWNHVLQLLKPAAMFRGVTTCECECLCFVSPWCFDQTTSSTFQ